MYVNVAFFLPFLIQEENLGLPWFATLLMCKTKTSNSTGNQSVEWDPEIIISLEIMILSNMNRELTDLIIHIFPLFWYSWLLDVNRSFILTYLTYLKGHFWGNLLY